MISNNSILILSVESSGSTCGVALSDNNNIISEKVLYNDKSHDKNLAQFTRDILNENSLTVAQLNAVAVSAGPGSFTGLRIGGALAKALCFNNHPKFIAVPTLNALVYSAMNNLPNNDYHKIVALVPSHKDLIYYQYFSLSGEKLSEVIFGEEEDLKNQLSDKIYICGTASESLIPDDSPNHIVLSPVLISRYAYKMYLENQFSSAEDYKPIYIQDFHPKIKSK